MSEHPVVGLIRGLRGDHPTKCDWCGTPHNEYELSPASGGEWVCRACEIKMYKEFAEQRREAERK